MMPAKYDRYIEVFGGGGWVLFGKEPDKGVMEVFNDYNADLINLYRCVKNRTWELLQVLGFLPLNSRDEFMEIKSFLEMGECGRKQVAEELELAFHNLPPAEFEEMQGLLQGKAVAEDVRRAAAFYKIIRYSYGSGCTSYSCQPFDVRKVFSLIREAAERLADTVIENKDFEALIRQYDREGAFFYCDPPYYMTEDYYEVSFPEQDHIRLKNTLAGCQGKWMVSYNDCSYIRDLYAGYYLTEATRLNNMAQRYEKGSEYREGTTEILPELKYMEVIAVTASSGNDANTEAQEEGEEKELPGTVTLLAAPEQSKLLAELEAEGKIHLSLVYRGERENAEKFVAAQDSILKGLEKEKDGKDNGQTEDMEVHVTDKLPENDAEAEDTAEESLSADEIQESEESTEEPQEVQEP